MVRAERESSNRFDRAIAPGAPAQASRASDSASSNEPTRLRDIARSLTQGPAGSVKLRILRGDETLDLEAARLPSSVLTKQIPQKLHQIGRRFSRIAAGAFTATLSLSSAAAQSQDLGL